MEGLDIYDKYQDWPNPQATVNAGVKWLWFKGTDGTGRANVSAKAFVDKANSVGLPCGLYHYAQFGDPRQQADVLMAEVHRLGALGVMPVLDLEDPFTPGVSARNFAISFLRRLKELGVSRPVLYANTSMLKGIDSNSIRTAVPGTIIWCANYGPNNGLKNTTQFYNAIKLTGGGSLHVDVWQYTSVGSVPGVTGNVDRNWAFNNSHLMTGDDVATAQEVWSFLIPVRDASPPLNVSAAEMTMHTNYAAWSAVNGINELKTMIAAMQGTLTTNQIALLTAISEDNTEVTLTEEQMLQLQDGLGEATQRAWFRLLKAKFEPSAE